ncbi:hypothetical protein KCU77_g16662, partial [Aureobasidium melanogenum]
MASACGRPSLLLQPARDDDVQRERETYKYYQPLQDLHQAGQSTSAPPSQPDCALTAFAQLAAFRLGARRTFVSLIDRKYQYVLAEATKTLSLEKNTVDDDKDNLWVGATAFERRATPCEYAAGLLVAPDLLVSEDQGDVIVFPDLSEHVLFRDHILVTEVPHGRFYAGVPIISPSGYNIGVFCVLDDKPRADGLSTTEIGFMKDMAVTIMNHLAMVRATAELNRSQNMVQGLGQFVDGKSSIKDWWKGLNQAESDRPRSRTGTERNGRSGTRSLRFSNRHLRPSPTRKHSLEESPAPGNALGPQDGAPDAPTISPSTTPLQETQQPSEEASVANRLQEDSISPDIKSTFQRAADIIRESVDVDGAIFLDASIGSFAGL